MDNPNYTKFSRLNNWQDVTESELKIFVAHLLLMGVLRKPEMEFTYRPFIDLSMDESCCVRICHLHHYCKKYLSQHVQKNSGVNDFTCISLPQHVECNRTVIHCAKNSYKTSYFPPILSL